MSIESLLGQMNNKLGDNKVITPYHIAEKMVNDVLNSIDLTLETTFLDPVCKSGIFLKILYDKLMTHPVLVNSFEKPEDRKEYILDKMLYGIALDETCQLISARTLYGQVKQTAGNIVYIKDYVRNIKDAKYEKVKESIEKEFNIMKKFGVIIGNPPYQDESGKSSIYNKFVELSSTMCNTLCMITRDNWMNGKAFKMMRNNLVGGGQIHSIVHYPKAGEVFKGVGVSVAWFIWRKGETSNMTRYTCIRDGSIVIEQDIDVSTGIIYKSDISKNIMGKLNTVGDWVYKYNTRSYPFMDQRKRLSMDCTVIEDEDHDVMVIINGDIPVYVSINNFMNVGEVRKYKVMCGVIVNEASKEKPGNVLTNIKAIGKNVVASETWSLIATFDSEIEAVNCKKYIQTQFTRFITNQSVNGRSNVTDNTFMFVPLQDFTSSSDIDWNQPISEIDKQLYKKYNLSQEEIDYIEKTIKPMN